MAVSPDEAGTWRVKISLKFLITFYCDSLIIYPKALVPKIRVSQCLFTFAILEYKFEVLSFLQIALILMLSEFFRPRMQLYACKIVIWQCSFKGDLYILTMYHGLTFPYNQLW